MPLRMLDYWVRLRKKYPTATLQQYVVYMRETSSPLVHQSEFLSETTQHHFQVVRLWEVEAECLQGYPGLLTLLSLCRGVDPVVALGTVQAEILKTTVARQQSELLAATAILAGLRLEKVVIQQILRSQLMRESAIVQVWLQEGCEES